MFLYKNVLFMFWIWNVILHLALS